jgi:hypothetical protein
MASETAVEELDCDVLEESAGARVVIRRSIRKEYDSLDDRKKGKLNAIMRLWCERGPQALTPEMFNSNEGRTSQRSIMLQAFKTFKVRLYGFTGQVGSKRTFVIVDADPAKKQNRADPKILKRAKRRVDDLSS